MSYNLLQIIIFYKNRRRVTVVCKLLLLDVFLFVFFFLLLFSLRFSQWPLYNARYIKICGNVLFCFILYFFFLWYLFRSIICVQRIIKHKGFFFLEDQKRFEFSFKYFSNIEKNLCKNLRNSSILKYARKIVC